MISQQGVYDQQEYAVYQTLFAQWSQNKKLLSVSELLPATVHYHGASVALVGQPRTLTYNEWFFYMCSVARFLTEQGVGRGDKVVLFSHNSCEFYIAYFAIWHLGAVVVPLNVYLHEKEMAVILADCQPKYILTSDELAPRIKTATQVLSGVVPEIGHLEAIVWQDVYMHSRALALLVSSKPVLFTQKDTALLLYTSGTTGTPKGVMLSSQNVMSNALQVLTRFEMIVGIGSRERFLSVLPLFHVFAQNACMWLPVMLGAAIIIVPRIERRALLTGLGEKPTLFFGFPALYGLLVMMRTAPLGGIKLFVSGADALSDKIRLAFAMVYGRKIVSGYGLTEASPVIAVDGRNEDDLTHVVGKPLLGIVCQIRDDRGTVLPADTIGTLWVRGDNVMQGYYNDAEQTKQVIVDGWLNTGDLASIDADGHIAICGRSKDIIIHKGFNIYPQEVENVILRHPAVLKAAVIGREEEVNGQVPIAFISLREGYTVDEAEMMAFCKDHLAAYKVPRSIISMKDLPMTPTGKIDKKQLRGL